MPSRLTLLNQNFNPVAQDQIWVGAVTYLKNSRRLGVLGGCDRSLFPPYCRLGDEKAATVYLNRLTHHCYIIETEKDGFSLKQSTTRYAFNGRKVVKSRP
jgi:hypothetical protein